jgi:8-oxo-dGTP pyrophosphatase MutT (NUDIX family)
MNKSDIIQQQSLNTSTGKVRIHQLTIGNPIANLYRKNYALILCQQADKFILGEKVNFYPAGISRMLGGGISEGESPIQGAVREMGEETGISLQPSDLEEIATVETQANTNIGEMSMTTHIFYCQIDEGQKLNPSDDISGLSFLSLTELEDLIQKMLQLEGTYHSKGFSFEWRDYGAIYGYIHSLALKWLKTKQFSQIK